MLMLIFNIIYFNYLISHLNTSNVNVNQEDVIRACMGGKYLNTSNVNVNPPQPPHSSSPQSFKYI